MIGGGKVSLLEVKDVNMNYHTIDGTTEAIKNISFKVEKEDFISIIGPSGCGKSTLLNIISGILIPSSGEVKFSDSSIKNNLDKKNNIIIYISFIFFISKHSATCFGLNNTFLSNSNISTSLFSKVHDTNIQNYNLTIV